MENEKFEEWALLELMGHRKLAGKVSETNIAAGQFLRIDIPGKITSFVSTQFYSPSAVYCITPISEETARKFASINQPTPITIYELPPSTKENESDAF